MCGQKRAGPLSFPSDRSAGRRRASPKDLVPRGALFSNPARKAPPVLAGEATVRVEISGQTVFIPGCAHMTDALAQRLQGADIVLFDGTLWTDDEMLRAGLGNKTGLRMGHMRVAGPGGTIAAFKAIEVRRKILLHINNSNPILSDDSPERADIKTAGWEVAYDGVEIQL